MIVTPADLKSYFSDLATDLGCSFAYGNSERILNRMNSQLVYPVLWLEVPEIKLIREGGLKRRYNTAFLFLSDAPADDETAQDAALDAMFALTEQTLQRLQADSETEDLFDFDIEGAEMQYKPKWSADDDWGWRTEISLIGAACETPDCCD